MKILEVGKIPEPPKPRWVDLVMGCHYCSTRFEVQAGDAQEVTLSREPQGGGRETCAVLCSHGKTVVERARPDRTPFNPLDR